ncbi:MAG: class II fructose-bisphosphate aldolase, partial [Lachnospiraceae bacterium]|nr:class II fructose-bisphosphate aldolase [Lachnospiraceae bacterium]
FRDMGPRDPYAAAAAQAVETGAMSAVNGRFRPDDPVSPVEAAQFCARTGVDCLAVSVGTAHGVYTVRQPKVDFDRLEAINRLTDTPLVLHGGSGVPSGMVARAAQMPTGGVSKVNIATDLELEMLKVVGREGHLTEAELNGYPEEMTEKSREAVRILVEDKITNYLLSKGRA